MSKEKSFETAINRLDEVISLLESNELPLDNMIELYSEGLDLVALCDMKLKEFDQKIQAVVDKHQKEE